jgi:hypothetical protein
VIFRRLAKQNAEQVQPPPAVGDPKDWLYSVPTICDEIPRAMLPASGVDDDLYRLHEDDWRQVEFVSTAHMSSVDLNLVEIRNVTAQRIGSGFPGVHVRSEPRYPLAGVQLTHQELATAVGPVVTDYAGVGYRDQDTWIAGSFAFGIADAVTAYGLESDGVLQVVGFAGVNQNAAGLLIEKVTPLLRSHNLVLVAWEAAITYPPKPNAMQASPSDS